MVIRMLDGVHRMRRRIRAGIPEEAEEISDEGDPLELEKNSSINGKHSLFPSAWPRLYSGE